MNIEIGKKYLVNGEYVEVLAHNEGKEVMMVKEADGNLMFILGNFDVKDSTIICSNRMSYTVTEKEMLDCINYYFADSNMDNTSPVDSIIVKAIRNTYYQMPTYIAEVVAEWYMR